MSLANGTLNTITLVGNLGKDAEVKTFGDKTKYTMSVATARNVKRDGNWETVTDWHTVESWNLSNNTAQYLKKGIKVAVTGSLTYSSWQEDNGNKVTRSFILADSVGLVDKAEKASAPEQAEAQPQANRRFDPNRRTAPVSQPSGDFDNGDFADF